MSDGSSIPESAHLILPSNAKILLDIWQRSQFMAWLPFRGCCSDASSPTYQLAGPSEQWVSSHQILSFKNKPSFKRPWITTRSPWIFRHSYGPSLERYDGGVAPNRYRVLKTKPPSKGLGLPLAPWFSDVRSYGLGLEWYGGWLVVVSLLIRVTQHVAHKWKVLQLSKNISAEGTNNEMPAAKPALFSEWHCLGFVLEAAAL